MLCLVTLVLLASLQVILGQPQFSGCLDASEFVVVNERVRFADALTGCAALGGELAVPANLAEHNLIAQLMADNIPGATFLWLGLQDEDGSGGSNPARFQIKDSSVVDTSFFDRRSVFPWRCDEPNDSGGRENCVELRTDFPGWNDKDCAERRPYVCRRTCTRVVQGCLGVSEFLVVDEDLSFNDALGACAVLGGDLAVPFNAAEHEFILQLIDGNFPASAKFWLGLQDEDGSGGGNPARFQLQDSFSTDRSFFNRRSTFPWVCGQPDDSRNEDCVELRPDRLGWNDAPCRLQNRYVCRRSCVLN